MANNFNFQAALKLNSSNFKKGVREVQNSLNNLRNSFLSIAGALGAGLGFKNLIGNLKDTAVKLSVAQNTLENVSRATQTYTNGTKKMSVEVSNYGANLEFVKKLSNEYSQDLISVTQNFAQFTAACKKTSMSLDDQKYVYEALVKASAYYHMSAEQSKDMLNAVTQMMSKGKVAAEELRRQLGNSLPGAFNLMAAAMGVSNAELEDLMRKGKVISSEVLPKFAAMLNTVTQNADFESLQLSINQLKNAWYELVDDSGAEGFFNSIIKGTTSVVKTIDSNISELKSTIVGFVAAIATLKLYKGWRAQGKEYIKEHEEQIRTLQAATQRYVQNVNSKTHPNPNVFVQQGGPAYFTATGDTSGMESQIRSVIRYNEKLLLTNQLKKQINAIPLLSPAEVKNAEAEINRLNAMLGTTSGNVGRISVAVAGIKKVVGGLLKTIGGALKANAIALIVSAIIGLVTKLVSKMKDAREEAERIAAIENDYHNSMKQVDQNVQSQIAKLESQQRIIKDGNASLSQRIKAYGELKRIMGATDKELPKVNTLKELESQYDKITDSVRRWCEATRLQSQIQAQANANAVATARITELQVKKEQLLAKQKTIRHGAGSDKYGNTVYEYDWGHKIEGANIDKEIANINNEIAVQAKVVSTTEAALDKLGYKLSDIYDGGQGSIGGDGGDGSSLAKVFEKHTKDVKELKNALKEGAITQEQYNKEFDNISEKYYKEAAGTGEMSIEKIIEKMDKGKSLSALEKWYKDLRDAAQQAAVNTLSDNLGKTLVKAIEDDIEAAVKEAEEELEKYTKKINIELDVQTSSAPKRGKRQSLFDYSKQKSDIFGESLEIENDYISKLKSALEELKDDYKEVGYNSDIIKQKMDEYAAAITKAQNNARGFESAMNLAKIKENIVDLKKNLASSIYGGVKNLASSTDRLVKGFQEIARLSEDKDATGWEKFVAVFDVMLQSADAVIGIFETINTITQIAKTLKGAEIAQQTALNAALATQLSLETQINAAKAAGIGITEAGTVAEGVNTAAAAANTSVKAGEAIAGATASGAKMPFPLNLIAIAAGIAAVIAGLAAISKFEKGGVVGGNSAHGDNNLVRANSGEMILTKGQQGTLWAMLNGKTGMGGNVQFKIRGSDLIGTLNNEMSRRKG